MIRIETPHLVCYDDASVWPSRTPGNERIAPRHACMLSPVPEPASEAALAERLRSLTEARAALVASLDGVDQETFVRRPPAENEGERSWSMRTALWHVVDSERCWREWAASLIEGGPAMTSFDGARRPAELNTAGALLAALEDERAKTQTLFDHTSADAEVLAVPQTSPVGRELSPLGVLDHLANHEREHAVHFAELRALPPTEVP